jgi:hypothetical protein
MDKETIKRLQKHLSYKRIQARKLQQENRQLHARWAAAGQHRPVQSLHAVAEQRCLCLLHTPTVFGIVSRIRAGFLSCCDAGRSRALQRQIQSVHVLCSCACGVFVLNTQVQNSDMHKVCILIDLHGA